MHYATEGGEFLENKVDAHSLAVKYLLLTVESDELLTEERTTVPATSPKTKMHTKKEEGQIPGEVVEGVQLQQSGSRLLCLILYLPLT